MIPRVRDLAKSVSRSGALEADSGTGAPGAVVFAKSLGSQTVAMLRRTTSQLSIAASQGVVTKAESIGMKTVYTNFAIPFASFDATSVAIAMKPAHPDAIFLELALPAGRLDLQGTAAAGLHAEVHPHSDGLQPRRLDRRDPRGTTGARSTPRTSVISARCEAGAGLPQRAGEVLPEHHRSRPIRSAATGRDAVHARAAAGRQLPDPGQHGHGDARGQGVQPGRLDPAGYQFSPGTTPNGNPQTCFFYPQVQASSYTTAATPTCQ